MTHEANMLKNTVLPALLAAVLLSLSGNSANAQAQYELYVDQYGRQVLVDPYTGEVVRVYGKQKRAKAFRENRRALRRERQNRYAAQRERRRQRLERELSRLWDYERRSNSGLFDNRPAPDRNGFYLDELEERKNGNQRQRPVLKSKPRNNDVEIARLPDPTDPATHPGNPAKQPKLSRDSIIKLQVFLDREGFSPGSIDGAWGSNVAKALDAWQDAKGKRIDVSNPLLIDRITGQANQDTFDYYTITQSDVRGPFAASVPVDYGEKALLPKLAYTSPLEKLGEQFHMSPGLLQKLNPGVNFYRAGTRIRVVKTGADLTRSVHYIVADKGKKQVRGYDRNGALVSAYPATIGSTSTPSPSGKVSVERIAIDPIYTYNPKKNFKQGDNDRILNIAPGPNNPVGSVWIALSKPSYGIHGTPNPELIGKTNSHGCIRLTNWDAKELASLITKGVTVEFVE